MDRQALQGRCHCGRFQLDIHVPAAMFPLSSAFCNCSSCRHATGQLAASFAVIPLDPDVLEIDVSKLSRYASSEYRTRYFCPECGANVLDFALSDGNWRVCTGILARTQGLLRRDQIFIQDTRDLGLSLWLEGVGRRLEEVHDSETIETGAGRNNSLSLAVNLTIDDRLVVRCHCGGIDLRVRPPKGKARYTAEICLCSSCRLTTGFELTTWASVPTSQVRLPTEMSLDLCNERLTGYTSSPGVHRYFCSRCGAAVLAAKDNQSWVDIAAGLLRAEEGARAENWVEWKSVTYPDDATDAELASVVVKGLQRARALMSTSA